VTVVAIPRAIRALLGQVVGGRYLVEEIIGIGGMAIVFRGQHLGLHRDVAIKVLRPEYGEHIEVAKRFDREARAAAAFDHPNCRQVLDCGHTEDGLKFMAMQLLEGCELAKVIGRPLPASQCIHLVQQILCGLEHAHQHRVIHRDLKPDNVIVTRGAQGEVILKILDFGLAKLSFGAPADPKSLTMPGTVLGTLRYMSPEQLTGEPIDERSDIFSIGVLVAEALTGRHPFQAATTAATVTGILQEPFRMSGDAAEVKELDHVLQRCLAKDRTARYATVAEARRELIPAIYACPPFPAVPRSVWDHETIADSVADDAPTRRSEG
jgi:serine/threonine protein kinase